MKRVLFGVIICLASSGTWKLGAQSCCVAVWNTNITTLPDYPTDKTYQCGLLPVLYLSTVPAVGNMACPANNCPGVCRAASRVYDTTGQGYGLCEAYIAMGVFNSDWYPTCDGVTQPCEQAYITDWAIVAGFPVPGSKHAFGEITCSSCS